MWRSTLCDELGYLKVGREQGNFLFRLVSKAYEKSSLVITTNKDFSGWSEIFETRCRCRRCWTGCCTIA